MWCCTLIAASHDFKSFALLDMAQERTRLLLQNAMLCHSDELLQPLNPIVAENLPLSPAYSAQSLMLIFLVAAGQSSQDSAAH